MSEKLKNSSESCSWGTTTYSAFTILLSGLQTSAWLEPVLGMRVDALGCFLAIIIGKVSQRYLSKLWKGRSTVISGIVLKEGSRIITP
jgi:hypothetical protein